MDRELGRRAALGVLLGGGVAGASLSPLNSYLEQFSPLSGTVWDAARWQRQSSVTSPYGDAELRYDDEGVPNIRADDEEALYFAAGYAHGTDRLFQMDLQRRLYHGRLAEVVGEAAVDTDEFHRQLRFTEAAETTVEHLRAEASDEVVAAGEAFVEGVNAAIEEETLPLEFQLLGYEPEPWTLVDSILMEKIISWTLTGSFRKLREQILRDHFGEELTKQLHPRRFDHDVPIIRDHHDAGPFGEGDPGDTAGNGEVAKRLVDWASQYEPVKPFASNSWLVDSDLAAGDAPILCNDPHLALQAPPVWYEIHLDGPTHRVRGVTFPGVPFVVIGENDHGAWGFTNAGGDVIDFYTYDEVDEETYVYGDEERSYDIETETIPVAGADDEEIELKSTVHGPMIEEDGYEVAIAWTGHAATNTTESIYDLTHSDSMETAREAILEFDSPTQNFLYADRDGGTLYQMTGRVPIRRVDGEEVVADTVFDGSAREGEWEGFEPFTRPSWEGFVPVEENPHVLNPSYISTANQRIVDDDRLTYHLSVGYAARHRGERIYDRMDRRVESGEAFDLEFMADLGRDSYNGIAERLVDPLVATARDSDRSRVQDAADTLADWEYHMDADSEAALIFDRWLRAFREAIVEDAFDEADLGSAYYPMLGALETIPEDSEWFGPRGRAAVMRQALRETLDELDEAGWETYGDVSNTGEINHPISGQIDLLSFLDYPTYRRGGSGDTVWNFSYSGPWGGGWEMLVDLDGDYRAMVAGGNVGRYFSPHYDDQLERWANGEYRTLSREIDGDLATEFTEGSRS